MVDTVRSLAALQALLPDNTEGEISAQDIRDFLVSVYPPAWARLLKRDPNVVSIDEFDEGALSGDWTVVSVTGNQAITVDNDLCSVEITSAITAGDLNCILQPHALAVGDAVEIAIIGMGSNTAGRMAAGPVITDGVTGAANVAGALMFQRSSAAQGQRILSGVNGTLTTFATPNIETVEHNGFVYLRVEHEAANTFKAFYSPDGVTWVLLGDTTFAETMTPSHVGWGWTNNGDALDVNVAAVDYVRVPTV